MSETTAVSKMKNRLTPYRRLIQVGMLAVIGQWSFYGIFRCPFSVPFVSCASCPVLTCWGRLTSMFWGFWLLLPVSVLLFGRSFCGWACPGGLLNQVLGKAALFKARIQNKLNTSGPVGMYLGLAIALFLWLNLHNPRWAVPIRVGPFFESALLTFEHANQYWLIRTFIVLGLLAAGLGLANIWCRYACPTGGLLELVKRFSLFEIVKTDSCNDCNSCLRSCEMGTRPGENNCTNCGDCMHLCPVDAIKIGRKVS
jgi:polyferredoxin